MVNGWDRLLFLGPPQHLSIYVSESLIFLWFIIVLAWLLMAFVVAWQGML